MEFDLLAQLPLRADAVAIADNERPDQPFYPKTTKGYKASHGIVAVERQSVEMH
jgi:hypothetical protein